ncbi:C45 family autoproteolytic acyltransferase/hydolase [Sutterella sp.]|uniref:C45 family autoproteolytic acyltransferase/hydolase n=1 Tax=Sutterella sp. TaxID=1981025 RepID=UPI0026E05E5C|nr:C45 family autoproteolytic acyltransferase/hydolase [Sutterella sp.]MDO5532605.1 C45 family autoproteolytic acyltransferase/hydrolase [Sutterella sp.]
MTKEVQSHHQYIKVSGTPHERGLAYGRAAKERIHRVIEEYRVLFDKEAHMSWETAYEKAAVYEEPIRAYRPDLIEEMQGIAEGAGVDFRTILLMNCRSEVMFAQIKDKAEDACSVIGVPPESPRPTARSTSPRPGTGGR